MTDSSGAGFGVRIATATPGTGLPGAFGIGYAFINESVVDIYVGQNKGEGALGRGGGDEPSRAYLYRTRDLSSNTVLNIHEDLDTGFSGGHSVCNQSGSADPKGVTAWLKRYNLMVEFLNGILMMMMK